MDRKWLLALLLCASSAFGTNYQVSIGDDTDGFFDPSPLTIAVGDTVRFYSYIDVIDTGSHNVVADDGSFRCARGCDGEGGDGSPVPSGTMNFTRTFNTPGVVSYHDEMSHAAGIIFVQGDAPFAIGPGITGAWYDPAQSGHGLFIEILSDNRFYASWFAFNPAGTEQSWFIGVGTYSADTATITEVEMPTGGRWIPNFDPAQIVRNPWGTLTFKFTDCDHGRVDFNSVLGYGTGSMDLTRLTQPAGLSCS
jgi:plastocyanin